MRTHTQAFKEQIKELGREIDSRITYGSNVITSEELFSVSPVINGSILKSSMKQLDFESSVQLPLNTVLEYQFGLKVGEGYEYLSYGDFIVYSNEYNEDMKSWSYVCYDSMLFTMKEYTNLQNGTFPMTVREYLTKLCLDCGLVFKNANEEFANYDKVIPTDMYANLGYTYRDILDELSQVTASTICLDSNNQVEVRYITETNDTIDEEYLKDINVKFGEKYGPINSIVLSRSAESDNVYLRDEDSIASNGLCELKIIDNQIMNDNNRSDYLPDILEKLNGLEYYTNDYSSTGILYYELCDRYTVKIGENTYSCVLFNDEPKITQGLVENIYTELPEESQTDYTKSDKTDRKINQAFIIVDKQNQEIQALASKVVDVSSTVEGIGSITLENASGTDLHKLVIKNATQFFPGLTQYPSNTLYPRSSNLIVEYADNSTTKIKLPSLNLLVYEGQKDDLTIENGVAILTKRITINANGDMSLLDIPEITDLGQVFIPLKEGTNKIYLESFSSAQLEATYLLKNEYTDVFAPQVEVSSQIKVASDEINLEVAKKVNGDEVVSTINQSPDLISLKSNRLEIESNYFQLTKDGTIKATAGEIGGFNLGETQFVANVSTTYNFTQSDYEKVRDYIMEEITLTEEEQLKYDVNGDGKVNSADYVLIQNMIDGTTSNIINGTFTLDTQQSLRSLILKDNNGKILTSIGLNGIQSPFVNAENNLFVGDTISMHGSGGVISLGGSRHDTKINLWGSDGSIECVSLTQTSLEDKKKNIEKFDEGLSIINATDIYKYHFKTQTDEEKKHIGFVIGDKYNYSSEITAIDKANKEIGVDTYSMVSVCFNAIKELNNKIEQLENKIKELESDK